MPPFRAGLLKRKINTKSTTGESQKSSNNEQSESGSEDALLPAELNLEGDDTDSEQGSAESDHEQDEILYGDDADSTLGDEQAEQASDNSSELEDSEGDDDSNDEDNSEEFGNDEETDEDESDAESGIGQTHSSGSESGKKPDRKQKQKVKIIKKSKEEKSRTARKDTKISIDRLADSIKNASVTTQPVAQKDEYESGDTSDEEERQNTAGEIPMWWYNEYPHIGYDLDGRRIMKPPQRDQIDEFLKKCEDPEFWRTVRDPATGQDVVLSKEDLELLHRLRSGQVPDPGHDEYKPWVEWFSSVPLATPLRAFPDHKRSFLPSAGERRRVSRLVHALRCGWLKTRKQLARERKQNKEKKFYNLWGSTTEDEEQKLRGIHKHIPAPRRPLPAHGESYNPPPEYLLDAKEMKEWDKLSETPWKRKYTFLPTKHDSLRQVGAYERFTRERFLRCLDLYLAPRAIKMRLTITAEELVPKLPAPRELQPFPTAEALVLRGHAGLVRAAGFDPSGQYVVSGSDDGTVKVWESGTGRCLRTVRAGAAVASAAWAPAGGLSLVAVAAGARLLLLNPGAGVGAHRAAARTDLLLRDPPPEDRERPVDERTRAAVTWDAVTPEEWARGVRLAVTHSYPLAHVAWHARGDYVCCTAREGASRAVAVHQVSRRRSQLPFSRALGQVQCALFHPTKPTLFVATQRAVRVYDLVKQELVRKLTPGAQWISCMAIHPGGDNLLVGSYDRKLAWFDLELSAKPYRTLRLHGTAVRSVAFHPRYPLFASAGDDKYIVVSHGMVYNDLLQNPLLVPLKQLGGGAKREELCTLALAWHPRQPWLLAAGADAQLRLYS